MGRGLGRGEELGVGGGGWGVRYLGRGSGLSGVGLWEGLGGVVGWGLGEVNPGFFSLVLKLLSCSPLFFLPSASTFLWKTEGILAATVFILFLFMVVSQFLQFIFSLVCL